MRRLLLDLLVQNMNLKRPLRNRREREVIQDKKLSLCSPNGFTLKNSCTEKNLAPKKSCTEKKYCTKKHLAPKKSCTEKNLALKKILHSNLKKNLAFEKKNTTEMKKSTHIPNAAPYFSDSICRLNTNYIEELKLLRACTYVRKTRNWKAAFNLRLNVFRL